MMKIPLAKPVFDEEMKEAALSALQNEKLVLGESVFKFEEEFARYIGTRKAVSISSGTDALILALAACGINEGAPVACPANSFIASANSVMANRMSPVFVDVEQSTGGIDTSTLNSIKYRAVLPVHIYGNPCRMKEIVADAKEKNAVVIEDACQAHGAEYGGRKVGSIGDAGCFSFYPTKNMTVCGDGGMVTTDNEELAKTIASLRDCGRRTRYEHDKLGYTRRLNTVNAAIGRVQLRRLDSWNEHRRKMAALYRKLLPVHLPLAETPGSVPAYYIFPIKTAKRDELWKHLGDNGVEASVHFPIPIHKQPIYENGTSLPNAERFADEVLSLPMYAALTSEDVKYICECVNGFLSKITD